jgi:hypothetical protein
MEMVVAIAADFSHAAPLLPKRRSACVVIPHLVLRASPVI